MTDTEFCSLSSYSICVPPTLQCAAHTNTVAWQRVTIVQLQCLVVAVRAVGVTAMRRFATRTMVVNTPIRRFTLILMTDA